MANLWETTEPTQVGADLIMGSLIKNPGGGLAPMGGYVAGRRDLVECAATRMTVPGIGRECGASLGNNRALYQGLFLAPHTVAQATKLRCLPPRSWNCWATVLILCLRRSATTLSK